VVYQGVGWSPVNILLMGWSNNDGKLIILARKVFSVSRKLSGSPELQLQKHYHFEFVISVTGDE
jgi:hypothetical protein